MNKREIILGEKDAICMHCCGFGFFHVKENECRYCHGTGYLDWLGKILHPEMIDEEIENLDLES